MVESGNVTIKAWQAVATQTYADNPKNSTTFFQYNHSIQTVAGAGADLDGKKKVVLFNSKIEYKCKIFNHDKKFLGMY